ncbi:MAG: lysophospholipid acyltransferase family protein [Gemmatimonadales bacterium]
MPDSPLVPAIGDQVPQRGNAFSRLAAILAMRLSGWRFEGEMPNLPQFVVIVAPHTSNWDFAVGVMAMFALGIRGTFLGKHSLFRWPLGAMMRWLGGVPVDRSASHNVVEQTTDYFRHRPQIVLALSPEGTRRKLPEWRTGFWYVAKGASVPIVPMAFDYSRRMFRIYPPVVTSESRERDFEQLHALFDAKMARHPDRY